MESIPERFAETHRKVVITWKRICRKLELALRAKKKNSDLGKRIFGHKHLYLMLLPCIVFFVIFSYIPMGGLMLAFKNYQFNKGILGSPWVGLTYFKAFFNDYQSGKLIKNTFIISSIKVFLGFLFRFCLH